MWDVVVKECLEELSFVFSLREVATLARVWVSHVLANVATHHFKVGGPLGQCANPGCRTDCHDSRRSAA